MMKQLYSKLKAPWMKGLKYYWCKCRRTLLIFKYDDDCAVLGSECAIYLDNGVTDLVWEGLSQGSHIGLWQVTEPRLPGLRPSSSSTIASVCSIGDHDGARRNMNGSCSCQLLKTMKWNSEGMKCNEQLKASTVYCRLLLQALHNSFKAAAACSQQHNYHH